MQGWLLHSPWREKRRNRLRRKLLNEKQLSETRLSAHIDLNSLDLDADSIESVEKTLDGDQDCRRHRKFVPSGAVADSETRTSSNRPPGQCSHQNGPGNVTSAPPIHQTTIPLSNCSSPLPTFHPEEIILGRLLGRGGFSEVIEVLGFREVSCRATALGSGGGTYQQRHPVDGSAEDESRTFLIDNVMTSTGQTRYAVKRVKRMDNCVTDDKAALALLDLHTEWSVLQSLAHPNIIKLRAVSRDPGTLNYFHVMDRLYDTLKRRLATWKVQKQRDKRERIIKRLLLVEDPTTVRKNAQAFLKERLRAACEAAEALCYMHSQSIIHRDVKPCNIGFGLVSNTGLIGRLQIVCYGSSPDLMLNTFDPRSFQRDEIKLFDLGFARKLDEDERREDGSFLLTNLTGSLRYMAPEVALGRPYSELADVYSFSIVLWEMIALERPYACCNNSAIRHKELVCVDSYRPPLSKHWSHGLRSLLCHGWDWQVQKRYAMEKMKDMLQIEVSRLRCFA